MTAPENPPFWIAYRTRATGRSQRMSKFGPLLNSAVRTLKVQKKLRRHNRNAAPWDGDTASSHLAGVTVDLQRRGMSKEQIHWMEHYLFYMKALNLVEPEEERHQWVFHIMVSGHYNEWRDTQTIVPVEHPEQEKPETPSSEVAMGSGTK